MQFLPVFFLCILFVFVMPHFVQFLSRLPSLKVELLPVSVTALGAASPVVEAHYPSGKIAGTTSAANYHNFIDPLLNGQAGEVVGVIAPGLFMLPVHQQPAGQPEYVDRENNVLTEFSLPKKYGSTGLLAHNYLSGNLFYSIRDKQDIYLVFGDGRMEHYRVNRIASFQALKPNSPFSDFVDLSNPDGGKMTSADLFNQVYTTQHQLVFQTCIDAYGEPSWGRLFITAALVEPLNLGVPAVKANTSPN
jgi:hypothetical protein